MPTGRFCALLLNIGSMTMRGTRALYRSVTVIAVAAGLWMANPSAAIAQDTTAEEPASVQFLSAYRFAFAANALSEQDPRFSWTASLRGDIDAVDFGRGRLNLLVDYETVLGDQLQAFDPIQGIYTLEASGWWRAHSTEIGFVFHHVSRHLGDRSKTFGVAWNSIGPRLRYQRQLFGIGIEAGGDVLWVTNRAFVDYSWLSSAHLSFSRPLHRHATAFVAASGDLAGVEQASPRSLQKGGRAEAGVRLMGTKGALELLAGYERRIDAFLLERSSRAWPFVGFRITSP